MYTGYEILKLLAWMYCIKICIVILLKYPGAEQFIMYVASENFKNNSADQIVETFVCNR